MGSNVLHLPSSSPREHALAAAATAGAMIMIISVVTVANDVGVIRWTIGHEAGRWGGHRWGSPRVTSGTSSACARAPAAGSRAAGGSRGTRLPRPPRVPRQGAAGSSRPPGPSDPGLRDGAAAAPAVRDGRCCQGTFLQGRKGKGG